MNSQIVLKITLDVLSTILASNLMVCGQLESNRESISEASEGGIAAAKHSQAQNRSQFYPTKF